MRRLLLLVLLTFILAAPTQAQQSVTLKHTFEEGNTTYIVLSRVKGLDKAMMRVMDDKGDTCFPAPPSLVEIRPDKIVHKNGLEWPLVWTGDTVDITFSNGVTRTYEQADRAPLAKCGFLNGRKL